MVVNGNVEGQARPRLEILDGLRFLAAMAVLAYHFTAMDRVWDHSAAELFPGQPAAYGWLGVHLFFLISGFVICMSSWGRGVGRFLTSRAVRLYPAYWLSVVAIAALPTVWPWVKEPVGWDSALVNLTMFHEPLGVRPVAEVYWTLWAELRFYLLFSLVVWWGLNYRRVVAFCGVWLGAVTVVKAAVPDGTLLHQVLMTDYAPLFTGGIGCYLMYRFGPTLVTWGIVGASFLLSVPAALFRAGLETDPGAAVPRWPAVVLMAVCFLLIAAVALGWLGWIRGRWLVVIGATTYPLYLLHFNVGGTVLYLTRESMPAPLLVVLVTAGMILLAWLVHRYVERPLAPLLRRAILGLATTVRRRVRPSTTDKAAAGRTTG
ncbi:acyltransferase family protein [Actinophytocola sp.]|uniref:acyltransferase family protein n=1 Tax=Actinophytocola sp. TaxID=1872138 RepID=UPI003D6A277B